MINTRLKQRVKNANYKGMILTSHYIRITFRRSSFNERAKSKRKPGERYRILKDIPGVLAASVSALRVFVTPLKGPRF